MYKKIFCIILFFAASALFFNIKRGASQPMRAEQNSVLMREQASKLLQSKKAKYISSSGQNALNLIAGLQGREMDRRTEAAVTSKPETDFPSQLGIHEVLVNDPAKDNTDLTTQTDAAVASFNDTVLVAYNDSGQLVENNSAMGYSRSTDGGRTFADMDTIPAPSPPLGQNAGVPGLAADKAGNFYASFLAFDPSGARPAGFEQTIGIAKSTDGGLTFNSPILLPPTEADPGSFEDKGFIAVDTSNNSMTEGNIYVSFTHFSSNLLEGAPAAFSRSTDGGASFSTPILLSPRSDIAQGSEPVAGKNGEVYVAWFRTASAADPTEPPAIFIAKSSNGGQSFHAPVRVTILTSIGTKIGTLSGGFFVNSYPRIDVSPVDGTIYIVYAGNPPGPDGADIFLTRSTDGGSTWSAPQKINDGNGSLEFFPDVAVNNHGVVQIIWYSQRLLSSVGLAPEQIDVRRKQSRDGGRSFGRERKITQFGFTPAIGYEDAFLPLYMGSYLDIKAGLSSNGRDGRFLMAWGDCRRIVSTPAGDRHDQDVIFSLDR